MGKRIYPEFLKFRWSCPSADGTARVYCGPPGGTDTLAPDQVEICVQGSREYPRFEFKWPEDEHKIDQFIWATEHVFRAGREFQAAMMRDALLIGTGFPTGTQVLGVTNLRR